MDKKEHKTSGVDVQRLDRWLGMMIITFVLRWSH